MDLTTEEISPSSQRGSLANRIALLESVRRLVMSVISGEKSCESWARCNLDGSWERTSPVSSLPSLEDSSVEWSMTWPKWAIVLDGECMELKMSEPSTAETESSLLHTPIASSSMSDRLDSPYLVGRNKSNLTEVISNEMLPTPRANQAMAVDLQSNYAQNHKHKNLEEVIAKDMLPTPSTFDAKTFKKKDLSDKTTKNGKRGGRSNLREVDFENMLATPRASQDYKPIRPLAPSEANGTHGKTLVADIGSQYLEGTGENGTLAPSCTRPVLNPEFVERMMGFPIGWTDLSA